MKKSLLTVSLALALAAVAMNAQENATATITTPTNLDAPMYHVSQNGKYAAGDWGAVALYDIETGEQTLFYEDMNPACTAKGVTNDGTIVGQYGYDLSAPAAVLKKGATSWTLLPIPEGFNQQFESSPQGVTPDGKTIVGFGYNLTVGMYAPLIWTLQDDGSYTVDVLPYPEEDIWGSLPQMAICYGISNDGTRAYGKVVDWTGYATLGMIYRKAADGTWSYQIVGDDWLINEGVENPGPQPTFETYVTAEPGTDEYWQQCAELDQAVLEWWDLADAYANLNNNPAAQIIVNQNSMSGNGKYFVMSTPKEARIYNVEDGSFTPISNTNSVTACSVTNNGDVILATPISMSVRSAYICPNGQYSTGTTGLMTWLESNYNVEYTEGTTSTAGIGTCVITPDGKTIVGFNVPMSETTMFVSTIIRIDGGSSSVNGIELTKEPIIADGTLYIPEGEAQVSIYNVAGTKLASFTATGTADLASRAQGIVIVKVQVNTLTKTFKVAL